MATDNSAADLNGHERPPARLPYRKPHLIDVQPYRSPRLTTVGSIAGATQTTG